VIAQKVMEHIQPRYWKYPAQIMGISSPSRNPLSYLVSPSRNPQSYVTMSSLEQWKGWKR